MCRKHNSICFGMLINKTMSSEAGHEEDRRRNGYSNRDTRSESGDASGPRKTLHSRSPTEDAGTRDPTCVQVSAPTIGCYLFGNHHQQARLDRPLQWAKRCQRSNRHWRPDRVSPNHPQTLPNDHTRSCGKYIWRLEKSEPTFRRLTWYSSPHDQHGGGYTEQNRPPSWKSPPPPDPETKTIFAGAITAWTDGSYRCPRRYRLI